MSKRLCLSVVFAGIAVTFAACDSPSPPAGPSAAANGQTAAATLAAQTAATPAAQHAVSMADACDPETFNAALGAGTCTRSGGVRFDTFLDQLGKHQSIGAWHFAPGEVMLRVGEQLVAMNRGGETHTFTEVEEFGGGIVPRLNELSGNPKMAPECGQLMPKDFLAPGASFSEKTDEAGVEKYQCCIHPWMRTEVRIAEK